MFIQLIKLQRRIVYEKQKSGHFLSKDAFSHSSDTKETGAAVYDTDPGSSATSRSGAQRAGAECNLKAHV